ncbi:MAG: outer-membrane lipoprotein carrier protein LolA [Bacteroidaceae bacterium]|nr:outer-membrane lipoprotein carrier protein LolA [Bacteroidaceae bacterium]
MKKILFILLILMVNGQWSMVNGQTAKAVLDKTAATIRNAGDIKAEFSASAPSGSLSGTVFIHKNMLHLTSPNVKCWFDGKTLWTYRKQTNEVNVTTPTAAEQQSINPYLFINIYKKGYTYAMRSINLRGKACHEVTLNATSPSARLRKMVITIDKSTSYPLSVEMHNAKGGNTVIYITSCKTRQKFKPSTFSFPAAEYKNAEIIDLR